jgi:hypothetical protein
MGLDNALAIWRWRSVCGVGRREVLPLWKPGLRPGSWERRGRGLVTVCYLLNIKPRFVSHFFVSDPQSTIHNRQSVFVFMAYEVYDL